MADFKPTFRLTQDGVHKILNAAIARATEIKAPMAIAIVDASGSLLAYFLMDGAKPFAFDAVLKKARTAANLKIPSGKIPAAIEPTLTAAIADFTNLHGGLPLMVSGEVVGAVAAGSGSYEEDTQVAQAGVDALGQG